MILAGTAALMLFAYGGIAQRPPAPPPARAMNVRHQQIIIRIPRGFRRVAPAGGSLIQWRETGGPRCIAAGEAELGHGLLSRSCS